MHCIIFGASGKTGQELVKQALGAGHTITAFVRNKARLAHIRHDNLTVIEGDVTNLLQVRKAIAGADVVLSALGVSKTLHHDATVVEGVETIVEAMELEKISRLIYTSVFLAYNRSRQFSFFASSILRRIIAAEVEDHEVKERFVRERVKAYTIVRPVRLTNKRLTGKYVHGEGLVVRDFLPTISRADVAHFILQQLTSRQYVNKTVIVTS